MTSERNEALAHRWHLEMVQEGNIRDEKIAEVWIEYDNLALMQQMGVAPQPEQTPA